MRDICFNRLSVPQSIRYVGIMCSDGEVGGGGDWHIMCSDGEVGGGGLA